MMSPFPMVDSDTFAIMTIGNRLDRPAMQLRHDGHCMTHASYTVAPALPNVASAICWMARSRRSLMGTVMTGEAALPVAS
jgi:hypothetical protein